MQEHRKFPRWQLNRQASLKLEQAEQGVLCQIRDLSYNGAGITLNTKLPLDTSIKMKLKLSKSYSIEAQVWVAWHKIISGINHYGLYFSKIIDADKEKIFKFISIFHPVTAKQKISLGAEKTDQEKGGEEMNDHRIFERFRKEFSARFIDAEGAEGQGRTLDISAKGLGLLTSQKLKSQSPLEIWLEVPNSSDPLYTRGQVVWSRQREGEGYCSGIELERADFMGMSRLLRA